MNKILTAFKQNKMKVMAALTASAAILVPAAIFAWGPDRPTFTIEKPASYVTFNSITNNPAYGDERNFVRIKGETDNYVDKMALQPGKEYTVLVYFHNNAASNLNLVATNTRISTQVPSVIKAGQSGTISAKLSADNAKPKTVWDEAYVTTTSDVVLRYVPNSAKITSFGKVNGAAVNTSELFGNGALVGYNAVDGNVPGCNQFSGYISYKITTDQPNFEIKKEVSLITEKRNWVDDQITANPGTEVEYRIHYTNSGTTEQRDVIIKDILPEGVTYVSGSALLANPNSNWKYGKISDNIVSSTGANIGSYAPKAEAYVKLRAKIKSDLACGKTYTLINKAYAITRNGSKEDPATVIVKTKDCPTPPAPKKIEVCELATKKIITIDENIFDSRKHSKNLNDCKETPKPKKIEVCEISSKTIVSIDEKDFDSKKHTKDMNICKPTTPVEMPKTGASIVGMTIGLGSLVVSGAHYVLSKRRLM